MNTTGQTYIDFMWLKTKCKDHNKKLYIEFVENQLKLIKETYIYVVEQPKNKGKFDYITKRIGLVIDELNYYCSMNWNKHWKIQNEKSLKFLEREISYWKNHNYSMKCFEMLDSVEAIRKIIKLIRK